MKAKEIKNDGFLDTVLKPTIRGITLFPFGIYLREKLLKDRYIFNHEMIHWKQQMELFLTGFVIALVISGLTILNGYSYWWLSTLIILPIFTFYVWYLVEWFCKKSIYPRGNEAYRNLSFEREAYKFGKNLDYLKRRKRFTWIKYIFKK